MTEPQKQAIVQAIYALLRHAISMDPGHAAQFEELGHLMDEAFEPPQDGGRYEDGT